MKTSKGSCSQHAKSLLIRTRRWNVCKVASHGGSMLPEKLPPLLSQLAAESIARSAVMRLLLRGRAIAKVPQLGTSMRAQKLGRWRQK